MKPKNKRQKNQRFFSYTFFLRKNRKGNILLENIMFLILNLLFLLILVAFLFLKMNSAAVLEEKYAKEIALIIDSAESGMTITLEMEDAIKLAEKENFSLENIVRITDNIVTVKLREKGGYSYSFFNDVKINKPYNNETKFVFVFGEN